MMGGMGGMMGGTGGDMGDDLDDSDDEVEMAELSQILVAPDVSGCAQFRPLEFYSTISDLQVRVSREFYLNTKEFIDVVAQQLQQKLHLLKSSWVLCSDKLEHRTCMS
ncbi:hypothetical protein P3S67_028114 [Capsicum chacoense]